jgi:hypothetical protein
MAKTNEEEEKIYQACWKAWKDLQYVMLFEEMAELTKTLTKSLRGKGIDSNIREEIADVQIMLDQMKVRYGAVYCEDMRQKKLESLKELLIAKGVKL